MEEMYLFLKISRRGTISDINNKHELKETIMNIVSDWTGSECDPWDRNEYSGFLIKVYFLNDWIGVECSNLL
jgi:hypothetical protein